MSYLLKLRHAEEHLERLEGEVKRFQKSNPYAFTLETDRDTGEKVYRFKIVTPIPQRWSLDAGDVLFNLRSGLDHLIFELATIGKGIPLTEVEAKFSEFPIFGERPPNAKEIGEKLPFVNPAAIDIILRLQPHLETEWADTYLWFIHRMNNIDKHRTLHVTQSASKHFEISGLGDSVITNKIKPETFLEDGTEIVRFVYGERARKSGLNVETDILISECFAETPGGRVVPFDQTLRKCLVWIRTFVVLPLEPFL